MEIILNKLINRYKLYKLMRLKKNRAYLVQVKERRKRKLLRISQKVNKQILILSKNTCWKSNNLII